uniref:ADP-ribosylation factor-related protein 1 n=1 Tax=Moschus moschiferus TaxID=68415 RepID=A0A8C6FXT3_MOSMO
MYTLLSGLYKYMFQKDEYCVLILGLDNAGKTTFLEQSKTRFNKNYKGMSLSKITTTVGLNSKGPLEVWVGGRTLSMLHCAKATGEASALATVGSSIVQRRFSLLLQELGAGGSGTKPQPHLSLLCSRHCGRGKGSPDVLGLGRAGGAAVSVGQGKMHGCHVGFLAPSLSGWYLDLFLPFLRRSGIPLLSLHLAVSVTHLVPEAHPHPSSRVAPPRAGTHWFL